MRQIATDHDLVTLARRIDGHLNAIRNILDDVENAEHPGKQTFYNDLDNNGLTAFA
jgi:hypothetical protein